MDIDLSSLLVFRHLALTGSFTETGKRWKISQPAVSLMISRLESEVGLVLLERSSAGTRLTSAGVQFLARSNEVCDAYLTFIDGMRNIGRRMDREVLIGIDRSWFGNLLREELAQSPPPDGITALLCDASENWGEALEATQYDVVVAGRFLRAGLTGGIQEAVIRHERGITIAWNPDFYPFDPLNFSFPEILRTSVLMPDAGVVTGFDSHLKLWCEHAYGMQPANAISFTSETDAATAAGAGLGVFLGPGDAMSRLGELGAGLVHVRTFEFLLPQAFTFGVYCRSDEHSKEVLSMAALIGRLGMKRLASL
ncbi:LysR family transcriptional regulator [Luteolibacter yonseiensis]|uniref:LysR family transcriptional regulator n=1 Tax=Luteolibacter yonseiensis TaxID=1144680 RepID=A0A934V9I3_9BACT|nr:LysR family transcriptional regulator [Luteolibacter yonseiensis]MBK1814205.1 LysR family transcriptional regulator [Luteolibacter yonseiensis]